jgi:hypothetical protein
MVMRALFTAIFVFATLAVGSADVSASHPWNSYHWARTSNPFTLQLGDNVDASWQSHLEKTSADWSSPLLAAKVNGTAGDLDAQPYGGNTVITTKVVPGTTDGRKCRPSAGTTQVCNAKYGANGWLGLAQIWLSGGHITQGVAKLNDTYFNTSRYNNPNERLHVMCQEVAHTFGLGHTTEDGTSQNTCMDYFSNTGANAGDARSTEPNWHDFEQLDLIYSGHAEQGSGAAAGASARFTPVWVRGAREDGTPIGASAERGRYYAQDLGDGRVLITHVHWIR